MRSGGSTWQSGAVWAASQVQSSDGRSLRLGGRPKRTRRGVALREIRWCHAAVTRYVYHGAIRVSNPVTLLDATKNELEAAKSPANERLVSIRDGWILGYKCTGGRVPNRPTSKNCPTLRLYDNHRTFPVSDDWHDCRLKMAHLGAVH